MKIIYLTISTLLLFNYCQAALSSEQILKQVRDLKQEILRLRQEKRDLTLNYSLKQPERMQRIEHKDEEIQGLSEEFDELWATLPQQTRLDHAWELEELYTVGTGY